MNTPLTQQDLRTAGVVAAALELAHAAAYEPEDVREAISSIQHFAALQTSRVAFDILTDIADLLSRKVTP